MDKENNFNLIRLLAALQVMFFHTIEHLKLKVIPFLNYFSTYKGVIVLFTVSGYLIYLSLERNSTSIKQYIYNRLGRIYPALWVSTIISFFLLFFSGYLKISKIFNSKLLLYWFAQITIFQFWTPEILKNYGVGNPNGSLATITIELQFYFLILLIFLLKRKNIVFILLTVLSIILNIFVYTKFSKDLVYVKLFSVSIIPYFYNFMIGVYFAKYRKFLLKLIEGKFLMWLLLYNIYVYRYEKIPEYYIDFSILISNILLGILVLSFAFSFKKLSNFLIGDIDISYGIYLYHMLFLNFFIHKFGIIGAKERMLYYITLTFLVAILSDKFLERPILNYIKNKIRRK
ncbi:acyltransferase family protein [Fusobacterium pseudoperiodonticum]|jgi:acyltransferase 3|uniref:acyltransferase family protein n=1 Tax=Fusobacterium pseudoperiodonticum TaxID=2663009 RepID=UPI000C1BEE0E|nr:acyltransferase [Fusobacterium pseudoperiodonticum]ATV63096.1 hypothetical protein CTM78_00965 [Fusobacterium pseudoperiodonticum]